MAVPAGGAKKGTPAEPQAIYNACYNKSIERQTRRPRRPTPKPSHPAAAQRQPLFPAAGGLLARLEPHAEGGRGLHWRRVAPKLSRGPALPLSGASIGLPMDRRRQLSTGLGYERLLGPLPPPLPPLTRLPAACSSLPPAGVPSCCDLVDAQHQRTCPVDSTSSSSSGCGAAVGQRAAAAMATNLRYVSLKLSQAAHEAAAALSSATSSLPEALQRGMEVSRGWTLACKGGGAGRAALRLLDCRRAGSMSAASLSRSTSCRDGSTRRGRTQQPVGQGASSTTFDVWCSIAFQPARAAALSLPRPSACR